ncbi:MAG: hypothetical protein GQ569_06855, partial [Methylococcaceae bacterium]|nr:hypothetical protein [Methylococcaceae bacterium]
LKLINKTLLASEPYEVSKLRAKLITPPYGLPSSTLAILAAVAIRHEVPRLRWTNAKGEANFAKNLNSAFSEDSKLTIRLFDFAPKQLTMLYAVGLHFRLSKKDKSNEDYAIECNKALRDFVNQQSEAIKTSGQLQDKTRQLVKFVQKIATNPQDLADCLIELLGGESDVDKAQQQLKSLLDDFEKITNSNGHEIKKTFETLIPKSPLFKETLVNRLNHEDASPKAKALGGLLADHQHDKELDVNQVTQILLDKPFEECNEIEIGECKGNLKTLIEYHQQPQPERIINTETEPTSIVIAEDLIEQLNQVLVRTQLPSSQIKAALSTVLNQYGDE